jgi:hypothetical protein
MGLRDRKAAHILLEFKYIESVNLSESGFIGCTGLKTTTLLLS